MKRLFSSEKLYIEEVAQIAREAKEMSKALPIGKMIKMIRIQLGMSQAILAKRASVPQSTISRIERGGNEAKLSTLTKILGAMFCDFVALPLLTDTVESIRYKQACKLAQNRMNYLQGTMNLEEQKPDSKFLAELYKEEVNRLLESSNLELWEK